MASFPFKYRISRTGLYLCAVYLVLSATCIIYGLSSSDYGEKMIFVYLPVLLQAGLVMEFMTHDAVIRKLGWIWANSLFIPLTLIVLYLVGLGIGHFCKWAFSGFLKGRSAL